MSTKRKTLKELAEEVEWKKQIDQAVKEEFAMRDHDPLAKLFSMVGSHLTGREVFVRLRKSIYADSAVVGTYTCIPRGRAVVDLDPDRSLAAIYKSFLHECGHIRHHYREAENNDFIFMDPGSYRVTPAVKDPGLSAEVRRKVVKREAEADEQADRWDTWASDPNRLRDAGYHPDDPIEFYKLKVLAKIEVYYEEK